MAGRNASEEDTKIQTYSEPEAARALGVSRMTLLRARKRGAIRYHRIGARIRYTKEQILDFLRETEHGPFRTGPL
jgi:excisionase family DNA binding protein